MFSYTRTYSCTIIASSHLTFCIGHQFVLHHSTTVVMVWFLGIIFIWQCFNCYLHIQKFTLFTFILLYFTSSIPCYLYFTASHHQSLFHFTSTMFPLFYFFSLPLQFYLIHQQHTFLTSSLTFYTFSYFTLCIP